MSWEIVITLIGSLGGLEFLKYILNRKSNKRITESEADKKETEADTDEFHLLKETIEFLQEQLRQKEERFADQTDRLRKSQEREFELMKENTDLKLELANKRCERKRCGQREPQNGY